MAKTPLPLLFVSQQVYFISCGPCYWSLTRVYYYYYYYNNNNNNNNNNGCIILEALFYIVTRSESLDLPYNISVVIVSKKIKVT